MSAPSLTNNRREVMPRISRLPGPRPKFCRRLTSLGHDRLSSAVVGRSVDLRPNSLDHQMTEDRVDLRGCQLRPSLEPPGQHGEERPDDELDADLQRDRLVVPDA